MRHVLVAFVLLAAGCLGGQGDSGGGAAPAELPPIGGFDVACGAGTYTPGEVCATPLGNEGDRWAEPYVAAHPTKRGLFVVGAQGFAAMTSEGSPVPGVPLGGRTVNTQCVDFGSCLHITEDAGDTWQRVAVGDDDLRADPLIAFVGDRMLVAALVVPSGIRMYATEDLGTTWQRTEIVTRDGTDRPWVNVHGDEVLFVWQTSAAQEGWWRLSKDGGRTWGEIGELPCNLFGKPQYLDGWVAACSGPRGTHVYRIDDEATLIATLPSGSGTRMMTAGRDGELWVTAPGPARAFVSWDNGTSWNDEHEVAPHLGPWPRDWIFWAHAPPWGGMYAIAMGGTEDCLLNCGTQQVQPVHLIHLAPDGSVLASHLLSPGGEASDERPKEAGPGSVFGEFNGIDCQPDLCLVAWMHDRGVDLAWLAKA